MNKIFMHLAFEKTLFKLWAHIGFTFMKCSFVLTMPLPQSMLFPTQVQLMQ
jgi:hypothetical protein